MVKHDSNCSDLVVLNSNVNCIIISKICYFFSILYSFICVFVFVDNRILILEVFFKFILKHAFNSFTVECQNWHHILPLQFQIWTIENLWVSLQINKFKNVTACFTMENTLEYEEFSDEHLLHIHFVNWFKYCLAFLIFILILNLKNFILPSTRKQNMIIFVNLQIIARTKRVGHVQLLISTILQDFWFFSSTKSHYVHSVGTQCDIILWITIKETHNFTFPKAKRIMTINTWACWDVDYKQAVHVNVDALITNQYLVSSTSLKTVDVHITDVKFVALINNILVFKRSLIIFMFQRFISVYF